MFFMDVQDVCPNNCIPPQKNSINGICNKSIGCLCKQATDHDCSVIIKCQDDCNSNGLCHSNGKCACYPGWSGMIIISITIISLLN